MSIRKTIRDIKAAKGISPLVVLTAYTAPMAKLLDAHVDILLVGDSLGMVFYGFESTQPVTLELMIAHGAAVVRGAQSALVVVDMPAGSYEESPAYAVASAQRVLQETGAQAVKLEGGADMQAVIAALVHNNIPVMGHVGLLPQRVKDKSGYRYQGRTDEDAQRIMNDAIAVQEAGAFAVVIEAVAEKVARALSEAVSIPTIGIGASAACDGQVLVSEDMLGLTASGYVPKFVKKYADLSPAISEAVAQFAADVRSRNFPTKEQVYGGK
jgi:3-methyl-2-oxobutanoate hydroxymethyltransferase